MRPVPEPSRYATTTASPTVRVDDRDRRDRSLGDETRERDGWQTYRDTIRRAVPDFHNEIVDLVATPGRAASASATAVTTNASSSASRAPAEHPVSR